MSYARSCRCKIVWLTFAAALAGCNEVLGINEPEEGPWVTIHAWDGAPWGYDGAASDAGDASVDWAEGVTIPIDARSEPPPNIPDVRSDGGAACTNVPTPGAATCGLGCAILCPLGRACLKNADCSSGRCFGTRCTPLTCVNGMKDGQESDVDCGGLCATCGPGRACLNNADCISRLCTNLRCQAPTNDAAVDRRTPNDASVTDVAPLPDASAIADADARLGADVGADAIGTDGDAVEDSIRGFDADVVDSDATQIGCDAGCALCPCDDGG